MKIKIPDMVIRQFDAVIIPCMGDPGLRAAREVAKIPVLGVAETSYLLAIALGHRFSIILPIREMLGLVRQMQLTYELERFGARIRVADLTVDLIWDGKQKLKEATAREGKRAIEEDRADVLVMGSGHWVL